MAAPETAGSEIQHPDILEAIFCHVPLVDLAPASHVSKSWNSSVLSSLLCSNKPKPWLLLHTQNIWCPRSGATHAYDPRSHVWMQIKPPPSIKHASALRSSDPNLLYTLTPTKLSFTIDPFRMAWHHTGTPTFWRKDPIVSLVGRVIVVAGGVCDFEDNDLAVELSNLDSGTWRTCRSMPEDLRGSATSYMLSAASDGRLLYLTEKRSGVMHIFDPVSNEWSGPHDLCSDSSIFFSLIAFCNNQLILIGLIREKENVNRIKLWRVNTESFDRELIGEMPGELVKKLRRENFPLYSIGACFAGNLMYICGSSDVEEMIACEIVHGGVRWSSLRNVVQGRSMVERVVCTCSEISLRDVEDAMREDSSRFTVMKM